MRDPLPCRSTVAPVARFARASRLFAVVLCCAVPTAAARAAEAVDDLLAACAKVYDARDLKKALELADQAVAADPKDVRCYRARATLHEAARDFDKAIADGDKLVELEPSNPAGYQRRGSAHFRAGHVEASIRDFDRYIEMEPAQEPYHWQRGIAYYYAGRFEDGRKQFELHQTVNGSDVENAAWHYLCVARAQGVETARENLIPISGDARVPMAQVHALFAGKAAPEDVLAAARAGGPGPEQLNGRLFYAHLYLALFYEACGDAARAGEHIELAAGKHAQDHYMGDVARVHAARLRNGGREPAEPPEPVKPDPGDADPGKPGAASSRERR